MHIVFIYIVIDNCHGIALHFYFYISTLVQVSESLVLEALLSSP